MCITSRTIVCIMLHDTKRPNARVEKVAAERSEKNRAASAVKAAKRRKRVAVKECVVRRCVRYIWNGVSSKLGCVIINLGFVEGLGVISKTLPPSKAEASEAEGCRVTVVDAPLFFQNLLTSTA